MHPISVSERKSRIVLRETWMRQDRIRRDNETNTEGERKTQTLPRFAADVEAPLPALDVFGRCGRTADNQRVKTYW